MASYLAADAVRGQAPVPFVCTGEAFIVQDLQAKLFQIDQATTPFDLVPLGDANMNSTCDPGEDCNLEYPAGVAIEVNGLGYRRTDGFLYAALVNLSADTNRGIVRIDRNGDVVALGTPAGAWPATGQNGGDVSADGATLYVTRSRGTRQTLHVVDLATFSSVAVPLLTGTHTGPGNVVLDYAVHPTASPPLLFGADRQGDVVRLHTVTGLRSDFPLAALPGADYGGAWFAASGALFVFDNRGRIFEIDLGDPASPTPSVVGSQPGDASKRNDAAACIQDFIGAAKGMSATNSGLPATVAIDYVFENLGGQTFFNLSADEDLAAVFGIHGVGAGVGDWEFVSIGSSPDPGFRNAGFNGHSMTELIAAGETLAPGEVQTLQVILTLKTLNGAVPDPAGGPDRFINQVTLEGDSQGGIRFGDLSTSETDSAGNLNPDPNDDGSPDEREPAILTIDEIPVELMKFEID